MIPHPLRTLYCLILLSSAMLMAQTARDGVDFASPKVFVTGASATSMAIADFNGDGLMDAAVVEIDQIPDTPQYVSVYLGVKSGLLVQHGKYRLNSAPYAITVGDINGDGKPDIVASDQGGQSVAVLLGNGDGTFADPVYTATAGGSILAAADFNGDGMADIVVAVASYVSGNSQLSLLLSTGDGNFAPPIAISSESIYALAIGDFNGDGKPDLAATDNSAGTVTVFLNEGNGIFGAGLSYNAGTSPQGLTVGHFNSSRHADLAIANSDGKYPSYSAMALASLARR